MRRSGSGPVRRQLAGGEVVAQSVQRLLQFQDGRFTSADATQWGVPSSTLHRAVASGNLVRPMRGFYAATDLWRKMRPDQQHFWLVEAVAQRDSEQVFAYESAAAIHKIPRLDRWHRKPQVISGGRTNRGRNRATVRTYHEPFGDDAIRLGGMNVTDAARTIVDLARRDSMWSAVASADYAIHKKMTDVVSLTAQVDRMAGRAGIAQARTYLAHVDGQAESPAESWSRVLMILNGFELPVLQQPFYDKRGFIGRCDFYWESAGIVGEFDGAQKYVDPEMLNGRDSSHVLLDEKAREDRLRRLGLQPIRWVWNDLVEHGRLAELLRDFGVPRVR